MVKPGRWKVVLAWALRAQRAVPAAAAPVGVAGGAGVAVLLQADCSSRRATGLRRHPGGAGASALFLWLRRQAKRRRAASCAYKPASADGATVV
jgi:hypothetical protein